MYCRNCGKKINIDNKYCAHCGNKILYKNDKKKKNKEAIIIMSIIFSISGIIILFFSAFALVSGIAISEIAESERKKIPQYLEDDELFEKSIIKVNKVKMKYLTNIFVLNEKKSTNNKKVLECGNFLITLEYQDSEYYISTDEYMNDLRKEYISSGFNIVEDKKDLMINGNKWKSIVYSNKVEVIHELVFSTGDEIYSFKYYSKDNYNAGEIYAKVSYDSLEYENNTINDKNKKIEKI